MTTKQWDWEENVLRPLHRKGMTLSGLAKIHGMTTSLFTALRNRPHAPAEQIVADFLGKPVEQVFAGRYPKNKSRILDTKIFEEEKARALAKKSGAVA